MDDVKKGSSKELGRMKHPFWLINSTLLILLCGVLVFIFVSRPTLPRRTPIGPSGQALPIPSKEAVSIDLSIITNNDLFNTSAQPVPVVIEPEKIQPMPEPPRYMPTPKAPAPMPKFLEPLQVSLRGIIMTNDERLNVAILRDNKTKIGKNYKLGDTVEDAQLIRIMRNKVILIRSNGQQETLYVSPQEAELDQYLLHGKDWSLIVEKIDDNKFIVDPEHFVTRIHSLAKALEFFDLSTVYKQGKSVGIRIGKQYEDSLAHALGLMSNDIITKVNTLPVTTTQERVKAYESIVSLDLGKTVTLEIARSTTPITIEYVLQRIERGLSSVTTPTELGGTTIPHVLMSKKTTSEVAAEKKKIMEQHHRFAPTLEEIKKQEKRAIITSAQRSPNKKHSDVGIIKPVEHKTVIS